MLTRVRMTNVHQTAQRRAVLLATLVGLGCNRQNTNPPTTPSPTAPQSPTPNPPPTTSPTPPIAAPPAPNELSLLFQSANHCTTASECVSIGSRCGIGCYVLINRSEASRVQAEEQAILARQTVAIACSMSCPAPKPLACEQGRCVEQRPHL